MPQVARGAAVPCPVAKVEHGSCAVAVRYFTSIPTGVYFVAGNSTLYGLHYVLILLDA